MSSHTPNVDAGNLFKVSGMIAVITGGGTGIGAMMARALAANGAKRIYLIGRRLDALQATAATCASGAVVVPIVCDVTSKDSLKAAADHVAREVDHVDVVLANSGVSGPRAEPLPKNVTEVKTNPATLEEIQSYLWDIPMEEFSRVSEVNVTGVFYTAIAFLPLLMKVNELRKKKENEDMPRPQIIATGSIGGFNRAPLAGYAYGASKAAVHHMIKSMATMWGKFDIRCNVIAPGLFNSEMTEPMFQKMGITDGEGKLPRDQVPMTRVGTEEEMAGVVLWLCSKAGGYTTGTVVISDGGRLSVHPATY